MTGGRQRKRAEPAIRANAAPATPTESITLGEMLAATEPTAGRRTPPADGVLATRYGKTPASYVAGLQLRGSIIWMRSLNLGPRTSDQEAACNRQRNLTRVASCLPWAKPARAAGIGSPGPSGLRPLRLGNRRPV